MTDFTTEQELKIKGIEGLIESIRATAKRFPDRHCPLLKSQLEKIEKLADALSIMSVDIGTEIQP